MDANQIANLAVDLMNQHGIMQRGWTFGWDRAVGRIGQAHFGKRRITLSREYIGLRTEAQIRNTILHEIAHVLAGYQAGHGPEWRRVAISIGCDGERCGGAEAKPDPKWLGVCVQGHVASKRYRRPKNDSPRSCGICSPGTFSWDHVLRWIPFDSVSA